METLEVDVLIVGGGPAGLSAALRLSQLQQAQGGEPLSIAVLEKAREAGAHLLSGAVLDPSSLAELIPDFREQGAPIEADVHEDRVYMLYAGGKIPLPFTPPSLRNHGNLHHLGQPLRQVAGRARGSRGHRPVHGVSRRRGAV